MFDPEKQENPDPPPERDLAGRLIRPATIWFEIDDLVRYFHFSRQPTGIQRVVSEILTAGIAQAGDLANRFRLCRLNAKNGRFEIVEPEALAGIINGRTPRFTASSKAGAVHRALDLISRVSHAARGGPRFLIHKLIGSRTRDRAFRKVVRPGDVLVSFGATCWGQSDFGDRLQAIKERHGLGYAMMVHDIIPAAHPEYFMPDHAKNFAHWLANTAGVTDLFFTPSHHGAKALMAYGRENGWPEKPIYPLRFGTGFREQASQIPKADAAPDLVTDESFVLTVSTIEIRKNHRLLVRIWKKLIERHGAEALPTLVCIGRVGWKVDDLMAELRTSNYLDGKIIIYSSASNEMLAAHYRNCLFTVFASFTEGWGLPVEESFAYGKACLCSNVSSVPEVGGAFADYFDPADFDAAYALVERAIFEPGFIKAREDRLRAEFTPFSWVDTFRAAIATIDAELPPAETLSRS